MDNNINDEREFDAQSYYSNSGYGNNYSVDDFFKSNEINDNNTLNIKKTDIEKKQAITKNRSKKVITKVVIIIILVIIIIIGLYILLFLKPNVIELN